MSRPFNVTRGGVALRLTAEEVAFLKDVPVMLVNLGRDPDHPATQRLSIPIYLNDPAAEQEYHRWMGPELEQARLADRSAFASVLDEAATGTTLSVAEAEAFMRVLEEGRLALGASVGLDIEDDYATLGEGEAAALDYLAYLQGELVRILTKLTLR